MHSDWHPTFVLLENFSRHVVAGLCFQKANSHELQFDCGAKFLQEAAGFLGFPINPF